MFVVRLIIHSTIFTHADKLMIHTYKLEIIHIVNALQINAIAELIITIIGNLIR